jgi:ABC-type spermidine/putrescine transport system permease subunit II
LVIVTVTAADRDRHAMGTASKSASSALRLFSSLMLLILLHMSSGASFAFARLFDAGVAARLIANVEHGARRELASGKHKQFSHTIAGAATFLVIVSLLLLIAVEILSRCLDGLSGVILS